jgi:iron complex outermembrane recepter protein
MKTPINSALRFGAWLIAFAALALPSGTNAQSTSGGTGLITGRVFNPSTGEYVRNVEIRIEGTPQVTISENGGYYRLPNAPVGEVTLVATYTGHTITRAKVNVTAGATATHDFQLTSTISPRSGDEAIKLDTFVVSTEREGQAKAIMEQKNSMNVKTVVAADNFGNITEANVGEFLKYMPGVTLDYVETDTRAARLSGMEARYGYVTVDGNTMANVNTGGFGADTRQFEYEAISLNNIDSIEVNKTLSADMPADAPAGTVNLRTKSALDRKGSQFNYTVGFIANQYEHSFSKTARHDDSTHRKARPTGNFDYSNSFFDNKLGVALNGSSSSVFKEQFRHTVIYDYTSPTAIARGRPVITALNYKDGPKMGDKNSAGLKLDYQPFKSLRLSLTTSYTMFQDEIANRNLNFVVGVADTDPSSTLTKVIANPTANANTRIDQTGNNGSKRNETTNLALSFTYKEGSWTVDGAFAYSRARGQNGSEHMGMVEAANLRLTRIGWTAERPSTDSAAWVFTQTAGPDWYDFNAYGKSDPQPNNITTSRSRGKTEQFVGQLNVQRAINWKFPTFFKAGLYEQVTPRFRETFLSTVSTFVGPGGNQLTATMPLSVADFRIAVPWDSNIRPLPVPDKTALHLLMSSNPEYFLRTPANIATGLDNTLGSRASNQEQVVAAYLMQNTRVGKWQLQGGLRAEETHTISKAKAAVPIAKNPFAIATTNPTTGVTTYAAAATPDYVTYKWRNAPEADYGKYHDYLPSASAKYQFNSNLFLKLGYNKAIKRPNLNNIAGPWSLNAAETQITVPNAELKPERSEKISAMVEYYFEPSGTISVHVFQTKIKNAADTIGPISAADFGLGNDPDYASFEFITFQNNPGVRTIKGIELSYSQQFTFLPWEALRGTTIFFNYARFNSNPRPIQFINGAGWAPQNASGGVSYRYKKFNASLSGQWVDEAFIAQALTTPLNRGEVQVLDERVTFDLNLGYRLTTHTSFFVAARNAFNAGKKWYFKQDGRMQMREKYGGQWTAGITGKY